MLVTVTKNFITKWKKSITINIAKQNNMKKITITEFDARANKDIPPRILEQNKAWEGKDEIEYIIFKCKYKKINSNTIAIWKVNYKTT